MINPYKSKRTLSKHEISDYHIPFSACICL